MVMKFLSSEQIIRQRGSHETDADNISFSEVDLTRAFIPEHYTQLYYCEIYSDLTITQQIRYNQLFASRTNEQLMLFESGFTKRVMDNMLRLNMLNKDANLKQCLNILLREEETHYKMFLSLNEHCFPEIYSEKLYHFVVLSWFERLLMTIVCRHPQHLVSLLWLVLLMEEHAVRFSRDLIRHKDTGNLGRLESNFVLVHQAHLRDELGHVHIDANLIDFVLDNSSRRKKKINVILLKKLLKATLRPRSAGVNVIRQLVRECPELNANTSKLVHSVQSFKYDPCMFPMLQDDKEIPVTTMLLELYPEFENSLAI